MKLDTLKRWVESAKGYHIYFMSSITHLRLFSHTLFVLSISLNMDGLSIAAAVVGLITVVQYVFDSINEYKQLIVTKELDYLLTRVRAIKTTLYWTKISIESTLRHASHSFEAEFQYKAFWEDLQRTLVDFKDTANMFNNAVHRICGNTGHKLSVNYDGLMKLRRLQSSKKLLWELQARVSSHESSIKPLIDSMTT